MFMRILMFGLKSLHSEVTNGHYTSNLWYTSACLSVLPHISCHFDLPPKKVCLFVICMTQQTLPSL